jgi:perosamine synthetase
MSAARDVVLPRVVSDAEFISHIVDAVESVTHGAAQLHAPEINGNEWQYVKECLDTEWVSTAGSYVTRFERDIEKLTGAKHAIATINGTAALHACLLVLGCTPADEIIAPAITFAGTANSIAQAGATPHFIDVEWRTLGLDPTALERRLAACAELRDGRCVNKLTGRRIAAIVPVHIFGHPCDIGAIGAIAEAWSIPVVEDAAESLGSSYRGRHTGTFGLAGILSFNGNKIVTAGGGGAIITNDDDFARAARHLTTTAKQPHRWEFIHDAVGYNYRLPNLNAALGCAQLERLNDFVKRKEVLADRYRTALAGWDGVRFFDAPAECRSNYWLNVIILDEARAGLRDALLSEMHHRKIEARPAWRPLHQLAPFAKAPRSDLDRAEDVYRRLINLPSSPRLVAAPQ